jgi:hypothetical protein
LGRISAQDRRIVGRDSRRRAKFRPRLAKAVIRLNDIIPPGVLQFLLQEGLPARPDILQDVRRNVTDAWRLAEAEHGGAEGETASTAL